jgi:hypothetical protein
VVERSIHLANVTVFSVDYVMFMLFCSKGVVKGALGVFEERQEVLGFPQGILVYGVLTQGKEDGSCAVPKNLAVLVQKR